MTKRIWKFELEILNRQQAILVPVGAKFIALNTQLNKPCLWAICEASDGFETRVIAFYTTGEPIPEDHGVYLGTCLLEDGLYVLHAFDITKVAF